MSKSSYKQDKKSESAKPETARPKKCGGPANEEQKQTAPPEPGSGGDVNLWCIVDRIGPGKYEIVISIDKLGVRKASIRERLAATATEAAIGELIRKLHALKWRRPNSVTVKCNIKQFVDMWNAPMLRYIMHGGSLAPSDLWNQLRTVGQKNGQLRIEHVVPEQIEATGLAKSQTRELDRDPRPFGIPETSPALHEEVP